MVSTSFTKQGRILKKQLLILCDSVYSLEQYHGVREYGVVQNNVEMVRKCIVDSKSDSDLFAVLPSVLPQKKSGGFFSRDKSENVVPDAVEYIEKIVSNINKSRKVRTSDVATEEQKIALLYDVLGKTVPGTFVKTALNESETLLPIVDNEDILFEAYNALSGLQERKRVVKALLANKEENKNDSVGEMVFSVIDFFREYKEKLKEGDPKTAILDKAIKFLEDGGYVVKSESTFALVMLMTPFRSVQSKEETIEQLLRNIEEFDSVENAIKYQLYCIAPVEKFKGGAKDIISEKHKLAQQTFNLPEGYTSEEYDFGKELATIHNFNLDALFTNNGKDSISFMDDEDPLPLKDHFIKVNAPLASLNDDEFDEEDSIGEESPTPINVNVTSGNAREQESNNKPSGFLRFFYNILRFFSNLINGSKNKHYQENQSLDVQIEKPEKSKPRSILKSSPHYEPKPKNGRSSPLESSPTIGS